MRGGTARDRWSAALTPGIDISFNLSRSRSLDVKKYRTAYQTRGEKKRRELGLSVTGHPSKHRLLIKCNKVISVDSSFVFFRWKIRAFIRDGLNGGNDDDGTKRFFQLGRRRVVN